MQLCPHKVEEGPSQNIAQGSDMNLLLRTPKFQKVAKAIRIFRMFKLIKLIKSKKKLSKEFHEGLKISSGTERLFILFAAMVFLTHIFACVWIMIGYEQRFEHGSWVLDTRFRDLSDFRQYM